MQLEDLQFRVRPRTHWEALDLGVLLAKRYYGRLFTLWLVCAAPVFLAGFALAGAYPAWAVLLLWWLKPVYERAPLKYLSRAVFQDAPPFGQALGDGLRAVPAGLSVVLTIARLSPARSFVAPVYVLEGLKGQRRNDRLAVLRPRAGSAAFWLTVLGVHVEAFLLLGLFALVYLLLPAEVEVDWLALLVEADQTALAWLLNLLSFVAMGLVAPFYVAGGFSLYLNRRVELEAWDVELGLRRLAARLRRTAAGAAAVALVVVLPLGDLEAAEATGDRAGAGLMVEDPLAEAELPPRIRAARLEIREVLSHDEFHEQRTRRYPAFLEDLLETSAPDAPPDLGWLGTVVRWLAGAVELLLWAGFLLALYWLARRVRWRGTRIEAPGAARTPAVLHGLAVAAETLPEDVPAAALALWEQGREREGLALVYRGALSRLITAFGCEFAASDTEGDCARRARAQAPAAAAGYLEAVTGAWIRLAYRHEVPEARQFAALCADFSHVLDGRTHAAH